MHHKRVYDIESLKRAKSELHEEMSIREAKIGLELANMKSQFFSDSGKSSDDKSFLSSILPSSIKPIIGRFLIKKVIRPKNKFVADLSSLLVSIFLK